MYNMATKSVHELPDMKKAGRGPPFLNDEAA
jgi:hypothetical protein